MERVIEHQLARLPCKNLLQVRGSFVFRSAQGIDDLLSLALIFEPHRSEIAILIRECQRSWMRSLHNSFEDGIGNQLALPGIHRRLAVFGSDNYQRGIFQIPPPKRGYQLPDGL